MRWLPAWSAKVPSTCTKRMSRIRSKDTTPEILVRRIVHSMGYRFRLHRRDLPGTPDLVFPGLKKIIDVRGCFWHAHRCLGRRRPRVRSVYWTPKLTNNVRRDKRNVAKLRRIGWKVLIVWDCETSDLERVRKRIAAFLRRGRGASKG
jgi:DNA mismatch endonuclease (patch repair protein)